MNRIPMKSNERGAGVSDKSSHLTGDALDVAKEFLLFFFGHLHKMVLVEPANVLCREVGCDREDCLARDLAGFGCLNPQLAFVHSLPLQVKLAHNLMGKSLGKTSDGLMLGFLRKNIPISFLSLAGPSTLLPFLAFFAF